MNNFLDDLNDIQKQAVTYGQGPVLILAGAGSGKTRVLTFRIVHLISQGINPQNILGVTFTNKAANEMKERVTKLLGGSTFPALSTFHSLCARILRKEIQALGYPKSFSIYDEEDQKALVRQTLKSLDLDNKRFNPNAILGLISKIKSNLTDPSDLSDSRGSYFFQNFVEIYHQYQKLLRENQALDFDDLLNTTIELFRQEPSILKKYQTLFEYVLVDEYQDTNKAQYILTKLLAAPQNNLTVVGDASQSIYSWRGATIKNILSFEEDYPKAAVFNLEQNYRSTKNILDAATAVILPNKNSHPVLHLKTDNEKGLPLVLYEAEDEVDEAKYIVSEIKKDGGKLTDFAILYRTNAQSRPIEEALLSAGIQYRLIGGTRFYERREIKDILAYLRFIQNPKDRVSFERAVNSPPRGIGKVAIVNYIKDESSPKIDKFLALVERFRQLSQRIVVLDLMDKLLEEINYREYLEEEGEEGLKRWENVKELRSVASNFSQREPLLSLMDFLENVALVEAEYLPEFKLPDKAKKDAVTLMTMHGAKGLEFPVVFLVGLEEGLFPHSNSLFDEQELEEERRLCYVGITRAMKKLYLTYARNRLYFGSRLPRPVSRFVADIPADLLELKFGESKSFGRSIRSSFKVPDWF